MNSEQNGFCSRCGTVGGHVGCTERAFVLMVGLLASRWMEGKIRPGSLYTLIRRETSAERERLGREGQNEDRPLGTWVFPSVRVLQNLLMAGNFRAQLTPSACEIRFGTSLQHPYLPTQTRTRKEKKRAPLPVASKLTCSEVRACRSHIVSKPYTNRQNGAREVPNKDEWCSYVSHTFSQVLAK